MKALLLVDIQNDFLPGGALPVPQGEEIIPVVNALLREPFSLCVATKDWHPPRHTSFASTHGKEPGEEHKGERLWPEHCVQGTWGAAFPASLGIEESDIHVLYKGDDPEWDSYSAFYDNTKQRATGLHLLLEKEGVDTLYIAGLATDYCVKQTVLDACRLGYTVYVIPEGCRGIEAHPGDVQRAWEEMREAGGKILSIEDLSL